MSNSIAFPFFHNANLRYRCSQGLQTKKVNKTRNRKVKSWPQPATLFKKRLWYRCFPVNFAKFLKTPFLTEHLRWLLQPRSYCKLAENYWKSQRQWRIIDWSFKNIWMYLRDFLQPSSYTYRFDRESSDLINGYLPQGRQITKTKVDNACNIFERTVCGIPQGLEVYLRPCHLRPFTTQSFTEIFIDVLIFFPRSGLRPQYIVIMISRKRLKYLENFCFRFPF